MKFLDNFYKEKIYMGNMASEVSLARSCLDRKAEYVFLRLDKENLKLVSIEGTSIHVSLTQLYGFEEEFNFNSELYKNVMEYLRNRGGCKNLKEPVILGYARESTHLRMLERGVEEMAGYGEKMGADFVLIKELEKRDSLVRLQWKVKAKPGRIIK